MVEGTGTLEEQLEATKVSLWVCFHTEIELEYGINNWSYELSPFSFSSTKGKSAEVRAQRTQLKRIEELGALLEEHLILDNRYTEHSTVGLAQQWDQLDQLGKNPSISAYRPLNLTTYW